MPVEKGRIVCSKAGRDKDHFLIAVGLSNNSVLLCDGKQRPIGRPKKKSLKHIALTSALVREEQLETNKSVRHALNDFIVSQQSKER